MRIEEKILELALKVAEAAEVIYEEGESRSVSFEHNKLKYIHNKSIRGMGLRIIKGGRIGFSSTTDLRTPEKLVEKAVRSAQFGQEAKFEFPSLNTFSEVKIFDKNVVDFPTEKAISLGKEAINKALSVCPDYQCTVEVGKGIGMRHLLNSRGLDISKNSTFHSMGIDIVHAKEKGLVWVGEGENSRKTVDGLMRSTEKILEKLRLAEREVKVNSGLLPIIFTPKAVGLLLSPLEMGCNGKLVQKGASPLIGRLGEKIADERLTIYDDPTIDFAPGSYPLDGEGVKARCTPLLERGVLKNYLFDLQTAGMMSTRSTGNGIRGFSSQPAPSCSHIIIVPGDMKLEDMIKDIKHGILVDQVLGGGQSNTLAGEFSVNIDLGFLIEKGELIGRVKDRMIAGNVFEAFNKLAAIGSQPEWYGDNYVPALYFSGLSVVG
ncbi:MAG TPA: TldD/PmbA family protein [Candidatus Brocadiales bacterium]|nr:TldD/PmbA family protein [Candidatus Brocadiales bacterium]